jgi:hypothetical protein
VQLRVRILRVGRAKLRAIFVIWSFSAENFVL